MSDLISRSELIDSFRKCYSGHMGMENSDAMMMFKSIIRVINEQPTAYDTEKVVAELEEIIPFSTMDGDFINKKDAIEIVRKGGAE